MLSSPRWLWVLAALSVVAATAVVGAAALVQPDVPVEELRPRFVNEHSRFLDIGGTTVHYRVEGTGEPLLLLHGTASSLHTWDGWTDELKDRYQVVRVDLPGFGLTGPDGSGDFTMPHYVGFLDAFTTELGLSRFHLAGNSLGGNIAWHYALAHPGDVATLTLLDSAGYPSVGHTLSFQLARTPVLSSLVRWVTPRRLVRKSLLEVYSDDALVTDELVDRYFALQLRAGNRRAFIERACTDLPDDSAQLRDLRVPTLVQWGEGDAWIPVENARRFGEDVPGAEVVTYPGVGHVPMEEAPLATAKDAAAFFARHPIGP